MIPYCSRRGMRYCVYTSVIVLNAVPGLCQSLLPPPHSDTPAISYCWDTAQYPVVPLKARHLTFSHSISFLTFYFKYSCRWMHITFTFKISPLLEAKNFIIWLLIKHCQTLDSSWVEAALIFMSDLWGHLVIVFLTCAKLFFCHYQSWVIVAKPECFFSSVICLPSSSILHQNIANT